MGSFVLNKKFAEVQRSDRDERKLRGKGKKEEG